MAIDIKTFRGEVTFHEESAAALLFRDETAHMVACRTSSRKASSVFRLRHPEFRKWGKGVGGWGDCCLWQQNMFWFLEAVKKAVRS